MIFTDLWPGPDGQLTLFTFGYYAHIENDNTSKAEFVVDDVLWMSWNDGGEGGS